MCSFSRKVDMKPNIKLRRRYTSPCFGRSVNNRTAQLLSGTWRLLGDLPVGSLSGIILRKSLVGPRGLRTRGYSQVLLSQDSLHHLVKSHFLLCFRHKASKYYFPEDPSRSNKCNQTGGRKQWRPWMFLYFFKSSPCCFTEAAGSHRTDGDSEASLLRSWFIKWSNKETPQYFSERSTYQLLVLSLCHVLFLQWTGVCSYCMH